MSDLVDRLRARWVQDYPPRIDGLSKEAADEIDWARQVIRGLLVHFKDDPHAGDLEWIAHARALVE